MLALTIFIRYPGWAAPAAPAAEDLKWATPAGIPTASHCANVCYRRGGGGGGVLLGQFYGVINPWLSVLWPG